MKKIALPLLLLVSVISNAQITYPVNGVQDERSGTFAFIHARIVISADSLIDDGTLIISDGKIVSAGKGILIPDDAVIKDLRGKYIYPSFIDLDAEYGLPAKQNPPASPGPQMENKFSSALNWNQAVTPEYNSFEDFSTDTSKNKSFRNIGIGTVLTYRHDGIFRGTAALVLTGDEKAGEMILHEKAAAAYSFLKGSSTQDYPNSQMGSIALLRQTFYDADWYAKGGNLEEKNISLAAIQEEKSLPQIMDVKNKLEIMRADKVGDEFNFQFIIKGGGDEYQRIAEIKNTNAPLIIPVNFPKTPDVSDPFDAELITIGALKHWEMAPANAAMLEQNKIRFAFTSAGLDDKNEYLKNIRKAIQYGLTEKTALNAMTIIPAEMLGMQKEIGSLEKGKLANFIITSGNIFDEETILYQNWVNGKPYAVSKWMETDLRGIYLLKVSNITYGLVIKGKIDTPEFAIIKNTDTLPATGSLSNDNISLQFSDGANNYRLNGWLKEKEFAGNGQLNGNWINWNATFANVYADKNAEKKNPVTETGKIIYPFAAYGWEIKPLQENILITNTTIWTGEKEFELKNYDVLIANGKIEKIAKNISAKNAKIIDGTNQYLTAGIIDEHSHIAISSGVNEGTQSSSAEVRIGDVLDCDDVNIYRQLAGGVTSAHLLHGSANPIGGQTQLIKLRWGLAPEEMKFEGWGGFIKFALGENVKQANWGDLNTIRFPQTRMGVEQVYADAFTRAAEYMLAKADKTKNTRTDLELEAIGEILTGKRSITCHSYVQSEINMLIHLSDQYHFRVNTFTHILEGYKVADKMQSHNIGGSSFSDWWAYKFEVYNAIPYNIAIMTRVGVVCAVNSDDAEMARRLNQEAAKSIKYGGLSKEEAWKLCTINPAKLLHVDNKVGSVKEGKDADLVLWNNDPLSVYARVNYTIVDGIIYYSMQQDEQLRIALANERARIITKMIAEKNGGAPTVPVTGDHYHEFDCDDFGDYVRGN